MKKKIEITRDEAKERILNSRSRIFGAIFLKLDGTERKIIARLDVKKHLKGGQLKYNPSDFNYIIAYDMNKKGYRTININTLLSLSIDNKKFSVV